MLNALSSLKQKNSTVIILLLLLNLALKLYGYTNLDIAHDEPFTLFYSQQSIAEIFAMLSEENNPPFHFIFTHYWIKAFGLGAAAQRLPSVIFSSLAVIFIYLSGQKLINKEAGIFAALFFTFSNFQLGHAHEIRVYALFIFLCTLSLYLFLSLQKERRIGLIVGLGTVNALMCYSHFFGILVIALECFILVMFTDFRRQKSKGFIWSTLITLILYSPYINLLASRFTASSGGTWLEAPGLGGLFAVLKIFTNLYPVILIICAVLILTGVVFALTFKRWNKGISFGIYWFIVPIVSLFIISQWIPVFLARYLIFITPGLYLLSAAAFVAIKTTWLKYGLGSALILAMLISFKPEGEAFREPAKIIKLIKDHSQEGRALVINPPWYKLNFVYHLNIEHFKDYKNLDKNLIDSKVYPVFNAKQLQEHLNIDQTPRLFFIGGWNHENTDIDAFLSSQYANKTELGQFDGYRIYQYTKP